MNESRENKKAIFQIIFFVIIFGIFTVALLAVLVALQAGFLMLPAVGVMAIFFFIVLYATASRATVLISEDEISSKTLLGVKTLKWSEIVRVSGSGRAIKLHNFDGDVTIALNPQLARYTEIVDMIGAKCPKLFNPQEYGKISRSLMLVLGQLAGGLGCIGVGAFPFIVGDYSNDKMFAFIAIIIFGFVIIGMTLFSPQSVSMQGRSIVIGYFFTRKTLTAEEISAINLGYTQTRRGVRNYYVLVAKNGTSGIQLSGLNPSVPVAYLVLKNWHRQNL